MLEECRGCMQSISLEKRALAEPRVCRNTQLSVFQAPGLWEAATAPRPSFANPELPQRFCQRNMQQITDTLNRIFINIHYIISYIYICIPLQYLICTLYHARVLIVVGARFLTQGVLEALGCTVIDPSASPSHTPSTRKQDSNHPS